MGILVPETESENQGSETLIRSGWLLSGEVPPETEDSRNYGSENNGPVLKITVRRLLWKWRTFRNYGPQNYGPEAVLLDQRVWKLQVWISRELLVSRVPFPPLKYGPAGWTEIRRLPSCQMLAFWGQLPGQFCRDQELPEFCHTALCLCKVFCPICLLSTIGNLVVRSCWGKKGG